MCYNFVPKRARSLMVKHFSDKEESDSSILSAPTLGRLAQWLEHFAYIEGVGGSSPSATTLYFSRSPLNFFLQVVLYFNVVFFRIKK